MRTPQRSIIDNKSYPAVSNVFPWGTDVVYHTKGDFPEGRHCS